MILFQATTGRSKAVKTVKKTIERSL